MQGLMPVFQPGHSCVLKVHNAVAHGTKNNDELVQRNYKLAAQVGQRAQGCVALGGKMTHNLR